MPSPVFIKPPFPEISFESPRFKEESVSIVPFPISEIKRLESNEAVGWSVPPFNVKEPAAFPRFVSAATLKVPPLT